MGHVGSRNSLGPLTGFSPGWSRFAGFDDDQRLAEAELGVARPAIPFPTTANRIRLFAGGIRVPSGDRGPRSRFQPRLATTPPTVLNAKSAAARSLAHGADGVFRCVLLGSFKSRERLRRGRASERALGHLEDLVEGRRVLDREL